MSEPAQFATKAYLGHKNIQDTVRDTELAPTRFKNFCGTNVVYALGGGCAAIKVAAEGSGALIKGYRLKNATAIMTDSSQRAIASGSDQ